MSSRALQEWNTTRRMALDEIAAAHLAVGGSRPGRRRTTEQINHAYAMLISSQFQGFCRDLHTEAVDCLTSQVPTKLIGIVRARFAEQRKLDMGNPNPGNLGSDFARLGINFWLEVKQRDPKGTARQARLETLMRWRNAIAHQDFTNPVLGSIQLAHVRRWRSACTGLARTFDAVVGDHLKNVVGTRPW